jgi:hypothetical protein
MRRGFLPLLGAVALSLGCINGGQPAIYKIALSMAPLGVLPGSCYTTGTAPANPPEVTGLFTNYEWIFWEGADGRRYLDIGNLTISSLGNAPGVQFSGLVEGGPKEWFVERKTYFNSGAEVDTRSFTFNFTDLGFTAEGTLLVKSLYEGCAGCTRPSCEATLPFNGRKIETEATTIYGG